MRDKNTNERVDKVNSINFGLIEIIDQKQYQSHGHIAFMTD
jgi:hypothetical protein